MNKFSVVSEIACNVETFWATFLSAQYNDELYLKRLGFPMFKVLEQTDTPTAVIRKATGQPKVNLPAPIAKLLGPSFSYTEDGTFDKQAKIYRFKLALSVMTDKMSQEGSVRVEPLGEARVRRVVDLALEAKVFGLGGMMESAGEKQLRESWTESAAFMNEYVKRG